MVEKNWDDVELPGMEGVGLYEDAPKRKPPRKTDKVAYRRTNRMTTKCDPCTNDVIKKKSNSIQYASHIRTYDGVITHLCFLHTNEAKHQDKVAGRPFIG